MSRNGDALQITLTRGSGYVQEWRKLACCGLGSASYEPRMLDLLDRKLRQMHAALSGLRDDDISVVKPQIAYGDGYFYAKVDFNQNSDPIALANAASLLVANIASLKDHLKAWCKKKGVPFHGDALINSNKSVALIHDLWNIDKHAELNSPPRSGFKPKLEDLRKALSISTGTVAGGGAFYSMDLRTGKATTGTSGGGAVQLALAARITDGVGNDVGEFTQVCTEAAEAWSSALRAAGVPVP